MGSDQNSGRPSVRSVQRPDEILLCPLALSAAHRTLATPSVTRTAQPHPYRPRSARLRVGRLENHLLTKQ